MGITGLVPLAAFGWVMATHMSLYPAILMVPVWFSPSFGPLYNDEMICSNVFSLIYKYKANLWLCTFIVFQLILLLGYGLDAPPSKVFLQKKCEKSDSQVIFSWRRPVHFLFWSLMWGIYVLVLCGISVRQYGGLWEMLRRYLLMLYNMSIWTGIVQNCILSANQKAYTCWMYSFFWVLEVRILILNIGTVWFYLLLGGFIRHIIFKDYHNN